MFKRRDKPPLGDRLRELVAPRGGWGRALEYWRFRMQRLPDSPTRIALGVACGVFTSFTPFFGFHFLFAAALAWALRVNVLASAIGTFAGNPLTFPFIVAINLEFGALIMGSPIDAKFIELGFFEMIAVLARNVDNLVLPYLVGGLLPGIGAAVASYFLIKPVVATYQKRRRMKLLERARSRIAAQKAENSGG